jgi:8-oxo-dGTP diphosphatase
MHLPTAVRRLCFKFAFGGLRVYWFLRRPHHQGVKFVLTGQLGVLLVRHTYGRHVWEVPGGSVKRHEDPALAASREAEEELGVVVSDWLPIGQVVGGMDHRHDLLYCFQADIDSRAIKPEPGEIAAARWFAWDNLPPDVGRASAAVLVHACGAKLPKGSS